MSTLSSIINTGSRALQINELAMQVLGHNIANVGTEGYSRRRVDLQTSAPGGLGMYHVGSGVDIDWIGRVRDSLLDTQIREGQSQLAYWQSRSNALDNVEGILNGLGDVNVDTRLQDFWSSWQDLANDPENDSSRSAVLQKAQSLASSIRRTHSDLQSQLSYANEEIAAQVEQVNLLTRQLASLNVQISQAELNGNEAPDLRDARDLILENISSIIDISVEEGQNGVVNVYSGGQVLVQVDQQVDLGLVTVLGNSTAPPTIRHGLGGSEMTISGGSLKALIDLRDADIMPAIEDLDTLAVALATRVNEIHQTGYSLDNTTGQNFFDPNITSASQLQVNAAIVDDPARIAAASAMDAPGDNSIALAIAGIQQEKLLADGRQTLDEFNRNIALRTGSNVAYVNSQKEIEESAQESLRTRRDSISGVSIDEEMTRIIQLQKAYEAAAQIVKTADEMINTLLSMKQ